ncbi:hypothetical protein BDF14DRAFT_1793701 [Spinellus fusiger]|nr:hypothetical protein BDF14DRAFT_1793701 [Spinellus fusiger]
MSLFPSFKAERSLKNVFVLLYDPISIRILSTMGAQTVDYRMSKLIVLCKDCGQDVGMYPARHHCKTRIQPSLPPLLPLPVVSLSSSDAVPSPPPHASPTTHSIDSSSSSSSNSNKWARFQKTPEEQESSYYEQYAVHLPEEATSSMMNTTTMNALPPIHGKSLWGKVRQNDKWKQLQEKNAKALLQDNKTPSNKLWQRLLNATQSLIEEEVEEHVAAASDGSDCEGESHVSRILREYYVQRHRPLPDWIREAPAQRHSQPLTRYTSGRRQRLWETDPVSDPGTHSKGQRRYVSYNPT